MSVPHRGLAGPAAQRTGTRSAQLVLIGCLAVLLLAPMSSAPIGRSGATTPLPGEGRASPTLDLAAAANSLASGGGPAAGSPGACDFETGLSAACHFLGGPGSAPSAPTPPVWTNISANASTPPSGRILGSMVWDDAEGYVLLFGGCTAYSCNGGMDGDTWIFQDGQWTQLNPSNAPSARAIAATAYDAADREVVLFGGLGSTPAAGCSPYCSATNDTWTYRGGVWTNLSANLSTTPAGRYRAAMAYDAEDGYVVMFGGTPSSSATAVVYNQTWTFFNQRWTLLTPKGHPVPKFRADMAYDTADHYVVLYGGCQFIAASPCATTQTWTYAGGVWTNETKNESAFPNARVYFGMSYDARDGYLLLVDGGASSSGPPVGGTWSFSAGVWTNLTKSLPLALSPPIRAEEMLAPDLADNATLLFGGYSGTPLLTSVPLLSDTWGFGPSVYANLHLNPRTLDLHQSAHLQVLAESDFPALTFWYRTLPIPCATQNASSLACVPGAEGNYTVTAQVNDSRGDAANTSLNLSVVADPAVASFGANPGVVTAGAHVNISVAVAGGAPPYHYAYQHLPSGCASLDRAYLVCAPTSSGAFTIEVQVTDAALYAVFDNTSLTVNSHPGVTSFVAAPSVLDLGQSTVLNLTLANGTGPFTYQYSGLPYGCASTNASVLSCVPKRTGLSTVFGEATDAFGFSTNSTVGVDVNPTLSVVSSGISSGGVIDLGNSVEFWLNATSGTAPYSYFFYGLPTGCISANASTMRCTPGATGNSTITGNVTDAVGVYRTVTYDLSVRAHLGIASAAATPAGVDIGVTTNLSVTFGGGTAPYTVSYVGLPGGCSSANVPVLACTPLVAGTYSIKAVVQDAYGATASSTIALTVNPDPGITGFAASPSTFPIGTGTTFQVNITGGTGAVQYVYQGLPTGCLSSDVAQLVCNPTGTGTFSVRVTVTDSLGLTSTAHVEVVVQAQSAGSPGPAVGGISGTTLDLLVAVVVLALLAGGVAALILWRRRAPPDEGAGDEGAVVEPAPPPWDEDAPGPDPPN
ncbi:MAG TPA: hypothetical protein VMH90_05015 [Thermoplasmata archaeon]|nr:hypothetical protein [Thermoplasmata archaeon]